MNYSISGDFYTFVAVVVAEKDYHHSKKEPLNGIKDIAVLDNIPVMNV